MSSPRQNNAMGRLENLADQLGCTTRQLKIGAGFAVAGAALVGITSSARAPLKVHLPPKNTPDTLPVYPEGQHWTTDFKAEFPIKYSKSGPASEKGCPPTTLIAVMEAAEKRSGKELALAVERPCPANDGTAAPLPKDKWLQWTWSQYISDCKTAAKAFIAMGTPHFGAVTIFGFNAPEWHISAIGAMLLGGKCAGIYPTDTSEFCAFKNNHSGATVCVVEDDKNAEIILSTIKETKNLRAIIIYSPDSKMKEEIEVGPDKVAIMKWSTMMAWSKKQDQKPLDAELANRMSAIKPGHCANIVYTSGTTGNPKGVMLSHDNICATMGIFLHTIGGTEVYGSQRVLSYLPLPHVAGFFADIGFPMYWTGRFAPAGISCATYFARPYDLKEGTFGQRLAFVKPTLFAGVPRVWEKIQEKMMNVAATVTGLKKTLSTWAKEKNLEHARRRQLGGDGGYPANFGPADFLMGKVREALGMDQAQFCITAAAPIMRSTLEYFAQLGIHLLELYGMSESSGPTTFNSTYCCKWGTIGYAPVGMEVALFDTMDLKNKGMVRKGPCKDIDHPVESEMGELCFRGRNIMMGYMANPDLGEDHMTEMAKKNKETFSPDGWLMSGDKACVDQYGMFRITGRYKELIITAGGENVAPVPIEDWIKGNFPAISNVMMYGDKMKYNTMLITLKAKGATGELPGGDELDGPALEVSPGVTTVSAAIKDPKFQEYCKKAMNDVNNNPKVVISNAAKVQGFRILPRDFSISTGEFTPTLKLKRSVAADMWKDTVMEMYKE